MSDSHIDDKVRAFEVWAFIISVYLKYITNKFSIRSALVACCTCNMHIALV